MTTMQENLATLQYLKLKPLRDAIREVAALKRQGEVSEASLRTTSDAPSRPGYLGPVSRERAHVGNVRFAQSALAHRNQHHPTTHGKPKGRPAPRVGVYMTRMMEAR